MSIFFDKKLSPPASAGSRTFLDVKWHNSFPLLAIIVDDERKGSLVSIYDHLKEETSEIDAESGVGVRVTCTSWHPLEPFLAVGFDSGQLLVWNQAESESFEGGKSHVGAVVLLHWSHCGTALVSADSLGSLVVWTSNVEGHIQPKDSHDFKDVVSQLVFRRDTAHGKLETTERSLGRVTTWRPKTARREASDSKSRSRSENESSMNKSFFVGLLNGAIFYLKDNGTSEEVLTSGSSVKYLLYHQTRDVLIVMTDASILGQFQVDSKGGLSEINKVKISGRGDINLSWAGIGTLAIISEELSIRLIDVDTGDNFVLEPMGSMTFSADEHICAVDFNGNSGYLCCNTNKGKLVIWKEINAKDPTSRSLMNEEDRWEWCSTTPVSPTTRISRWCPILPDLLAINAVRDVYVLRQQEVSATYKDKVSIVQTLANKLSVNLMEEKIKFYLETDVQVKGFTNTTENICIWSGQQIEIYEFGIEIPNYYKFSGTFKEKSDTIYLFEKNIFVLESHQIQIKSFQGTIKQTLTFTTDEGLPITLCGSGDFITAATGNGYIKIWHVGGREAKIHTPSRNVKSNIQNFGEIIQAKNNIEGSKVAFTIAKKNLFPDSRFYVWEIGVENLVSMNFPGHFVSKICWEAEDPMYIALELSVIPSELCVAKDEEEENLTSSVETEKSSEIVFSTNPYLIRRAQKRMKEIALQKYLQTFEKEELPSLNELQQMITDFENPSRRFENIPGTGIPPWKISQENPNTGAQNIESGKLERENEFKETGKEKKIFDEEANESLDKTSNKLYKKPMLQSKRRFRIEENEEEKIEKSSVDESSNSSSLLQTTSNLDGVIEKVKSNSEKVILENQDENKNEITKKSSVINLKSKKKFLDLAGFTRNSDGAIDDVKSDEIPANQILTLFVCSTQGILKHEKIMKDDVKEIFLALDVPYWYSLKSKRKIKGVITDSKTQKSKDLTQMNIEEHAISDFKGVDEEGTEVGKQKKTIKRALLNYVYHHLCGDVDKALMAMESIQSYEIWKNMARLCLTSKRVDVASICFARMKNVGACRALRLSQQKDDELDAQVAMVALQLDMLKEAEKLYRGCGRFDLLVEVFIACEQWEKAIDVCEKNYRIQLKTTYFLYGKYLEEEGAFDEAALMYEKSGTHRTEVLRMWQHSPEKLEDYVLKMKDKEMYKWWAQYLESTRNLEGALSYYELAEDWYSLTRLLCFCDEVEKARIVAETVKDKASCYHIAGVLYESGKANEAVIFYQRAEAFGPAMRICRENEMDEILFNMSHFASSVDQLEAAKYFETKDPPDYEKAVRLYHQSGFSSKAMDIAYTTQQFGALQDVARDLLESSEKKDPEMLQRCAEFFVANQQFSKALDMYASAKKYAEAMDVCVQYKIPIDEEMAERLTAPKGELGIDPLERSRLLEKMAECCMLQGSYHLAAKKFTQAGNKEKAMKVLLKSGDTDRIIHYANVSRHRDIYLMAANYLQSTEWQESPKIVEKIIQFYTKAKVPESIVSFYEAWALSSYEEDKNYRQSLENLKMAEQVMKEVIGQETAGVVMKGYEQRLGRIQTKIKTLKTFLLLKETMLENPRDGIQRLRTFVKDLSIEGSVSRGDVFAVIIEHLVGNEEYDEAVDTLVEMKQTIPHKPGQFIKKETLESLNYALGRQAFQVSEPGKSMGKSVNSFQFGNAEAGDDEEVEEEEIEEEAEADADVVEEEEEEDVEYVEVEEEEEEEGVADEGSERRGSLNLQQLLSHPKPTLNRIK